MKQSIEKAIAYLLNNQRKDGSWNGPLTSRIRETFLVYEVSKEYGWNNLLAQSQSWLNANQTLLGDNPNEILLNKAFLSIYQSEEVQLLDLSLYDQVIVRKTLMAYCLALINHSPVKVPEQYQNNLFIYKFIEGYLQKLGNQIKGWALAEMLCFMIILGKELNLPVSEEITKLLDLQTENNWFRNPATTAFSLIALKYGDHSMEDENVFINYFKTIQQKDSGWSYCEIPLWDTGLSLESLNLLVDQSDEVNLSIQKALKYFESNQNSDGGWGFDLGLESEADTSSIVLYSLRKHPSEMRNKAIAYYNNLQFKEGEFEGLWPVWRQSETPSIEVVSHIITSLKATSTDIDFSRAISWIDKQVEGGSWQADWGRNLPYAINAIIQATNKPYPQLIDYLIKNQNSDGGWGPVESSVSNPSATANAVMALKGVDIDAKFKDSIQKGIDYLISTQDKQGTWAGVKEVIGPRPFIYGDDSSTHNFVLQALLI